MKYCILGVNATFGEISYNIREEESSLEACVVLDGFIQRNITLQLFTLDQTAASKSHK